MSSMEDRKIKSMKIILSIKAPSFLASRLLKMVKYITIDKEAFRLRAKRRPSKNESSSRTSSARILQQTNN